MFRRPPFDQVLSMSLCRAAIRCFIFPRSVASCQLPVASCHQPPPSHWALAQHCLQCALIQFSFLSISFYCLSVVFMFRFFFLNIFRSEPSGYCCQRSTGMFRFESIFETKNEAKFSTLLNIISVYCFWFIIESILARQHRQRTFGTMRACASSPPICVFVLFISRSTSTYSLTIFFPFLLFHTITSVWHFAFRLYIRSRSTTKKKTNKEKSRSFRVFFRMRELCFTHVLQLRLWQLVHAGVGWWSVACMQVTKTRNLIAFIPDETEINKYFLRLYDECCT